MRILSKSLLRRRNGLGIERRILSQINGFAYKGAMMKRFLRLFSRKARRHIKRFAKCDVDLTASVDVGCEVGDYTFIGKDCDITKTSIGRYCSIAPHCRIGQGEHAVDDISTSRFLNDSCNYDNLTKRPCRIGNDVWLGSDVIVRRGVTIGDCVVIGANSFVNKDIPSFAIAVGSPARVVRLRWTEQVRTAVAQSQYWNQEPDKAKMTIANLLSEFAIRKEN